jgi:hypothetical protein
MMNQMIDTGNALAVSVQSWVSHLFLHLSHSEFDVERSMFDVHSFSQR